MKKIFLTLFLSSLLIVDSAWAAVAFDAASGGTKGTAGTSLSFSHTCSGSNRILVVAITAQVRYNTVSSVTYAGAALTRLSRSTSPDDANRICETYIYYKLNPATGSNTVTINCNHELKVSAVSASYTGVQDMDYANTSLGTSSTPSITVYGMSSGHWAVGVHGHYEGGTDITVSSDNSGQTRRGYQSGNWSHCVLSDDQDGSLGWTLSNSIIWADIGGRLVPTPPIPSAPTNVAATDGTYTDKVTITWTKSTGATQYQVYRDGVALGWLGDVATYDDTGAGAPTITAGASVASDGSSTAHCALSLSGTSANNGTTHTYKVRAKNTAGESGDSSTDTGYRGIGALTYQWQRSAADSDATYSNISGATTATYNDTGAPAPTITPGTASATDGVYVDKVALSLSGQSANVGAGRYYGCVLNATGATQQISSADRGYRGVGALTYQWQRSAADSDATYSNISGATTATYDDTGAPANGSGRYYRCVDNATGAAEAISSSDRGYKKRAGQVIILMP